MLDFKDKEYIDYIIYSVSRAKNKYMFRVKLIYADGTSDIQQYGGFKTKKAANDHKKVITAQLFNRTYVVIRKVRTNEFLEYWLENIIKENCTHNTYYSYKLTVKNHINPEMGNHYIDSLNQGHIQKLYNTKYEESYYIAKQCKAVMNSAMQYAFNKQIISCNITKNVNLPKKSQYEKEDDLDSKYIKVKLEQTLNIEQVKLLIEASKGTPIYLHVLFAVLMGLRRGEINGLKYSDIDYVHRKIKVQRQLGIDPKKKKEDCKKKTYTTQEIGLKTFSSYRELYIPDMVFEAILEERKKYEANRSRRINDKSNPFRDLDFICCSTYGKPRSLGFVQNPFKKVLKKANLPDIRFHDLRHTYSTLLITNNYAENAVSQLLGHSRSIITVDVYTDKSKLAIDCLEELEPFIKCVIPDNKNSQKNYTNLENVIKIDDYL